MLNANDAVREDDKLSYRCGDAWVVDGVKTAEEPNYSVTENPKTLERDPKDMT